jgi:iron complex outermembrane recepter protein
MTVNARVAALMLTGWSAMTTATAAFADVQAAPEPGLSAQENNTAPAPALEEIVVTAQRRGQNQQDVPISVTTITADQLTRSGVTSTDELLTVTPGLQMNRQLRAGLPFIRGVGVVSGSIGNESPVATYVDGVYIMSLQNNIFAFNNISRVEVLKGPQGTLFGRNATGGLINVITRDPAVEPRVEGSFGYGNYETLNGSLYLTGGAGDIAADFAMYGVWQREGWGHYLVNGVSTGVDVNRLDEQAVRGKILWTVTERDRLTLTADYSHNTNDVGIVRNANPGSLLVGGVPLRGTVYDTQNVFPTGSPYAEAAGGSLKHQHEFGWAQFQSILAYRSNRDQYTIDQDGTPARLADIIVTESSKTLQYEALLVGKTGRLDWTAGAFLFNARVNQDLQVRGASAASNTNSIPRMETDSYAAFVQGTYAITDMTNFTAGGRYTIDRRHIVGVLVAGPGHPQPSGTVLFSKNDRQKSSAPTWRFALDHQLSDDFLVYASLNRGFKSGTFNTTALQAPPVTNETLDAVEVGLKSEFFNHRLRFNLAAFHYKYKNIQLTRVDAGTTVTYNAPGGKLKGVDVEIVAAPPVPVGDLQLNAGLSWLDAHYTDLPLGIVSVPRSTGGNLIVTRDLSGARMIRAPEWTATLSATYNVPTSFGEIGLSGTYYYNDGFVWEPDGRLRQPSYHLLNAQFHVAFGSDSQYKIRLYGKNLTNTVYSSYLSAGSLGDQYAPAAPRTYAVAFDFRF